MNSVWITRSEPGASQLATALARQGYDPIKRPLIAIEPTYDPRPSGNFAVWVFLSVHAVAYCNELVAAGLCIAVGSATAQALRAQNLSCIVPHKHSSEGVIEYLQDMSSEQVEVLVVQGDDGRRAIQAWCEANQYPCQTWAVYRRVSRQVPCACRNATVVVCNSAAVLQGVRDCMRERSEYIPVIVPSSRVEEEARSRGFGNVWVSDGSSADAVIATLSNIDLS